jgi:hypothetical protein
MGLNIHGEFLFEKDLVDQPRWVETRRSLGRSLGGGSGMKRFLVLNLICSLLISLSLFGRPTGTLAAPSAVDAVVGECVVLESDCATIDMSLAITSTKTSLSAAGVWTSTCTGTTINKPTKTTKCDGERLSGSGGDTPSPQFACAMEFIGYLSVNAGPVYTDDWTETISPSGIVKMTCKFDPNETGK